MGRYTCCNSFLLVALCISLQPACNCRHPYTGSADLLDHHWLKSRRIFIDPGHGGPSPCASDRHAHGVCEDRINLQAALILADMLTGAGAEVKLSRTGGNAVAEHERARMAREFRPDLLVSIHHASSPRADEGVNFPRVMIWGDRAIHPASYDFAVILTGEIGKVMNVPGVIASDFARYGEGGATILRETRNLCPGVMSEAGFFTDRRHAARLLDPIYMEQAAEAHFYAISRYFRQGVPRGTVGFSCPVDNTGRFINLIRDPKPYITIGSDAHADPSGMDERTLRVSLDGTPAGWKKMPDGCIAIDYGPVLYPGFHRIRFQFRNHRGQSSMIQTAPFTVEVRSGDYRRLIADGRKRIRSRRGAIEGVRMLLSALSIEPDGIDSGAIARDIARGFTLAGDAASAEYYRRLADSAFAALACADDRRDCMSMRATSTHARVPRLMIDYHGKQARIIATPWREKSETRKTKNEFIDRIKRFFYRQF